MVANQSPPRAGRSPGPVGPDAGDLPATAGGAPPSPRARRSGLAAAAAAVALSAIGGAVGLVGGGVDLGEPVTQRLPLQSPVLGGLALAVCVAVPFAIVAALAWRGAALTDRAAVAAGVLLIGWIVVQLAFIRTLSPLQPICVAVGAGFVVIGRRGMVTGGPPPRPTGARPA